MEGLQNNYTIDKKIELLINEYESDVKRYAYKIVKDWGIAEDITQEVFLTCYIRIDQFRGDSSLKTWLLKITTNKCIDELKNNRYSQKNLINRLSYHIQKTGLFN